MEEVLFGTNHIFNRVKPMKNVLQKDIDKHIWMTDVIPYHNDIKKNTSSIQEIKLKSEVRHCLVV